MLTQLLQSVAVVCCCRCSADADARGGCRLCCAWLVPFAVLLRMQSMPLPMRCRCYCHAAVAAVDAAAAAAAAVPAASCAGLLLGCRCMLSAVLLNLQAIIPAAICYDAARRSASTRPLSSTCLARAAHTCASLRSRGCAAAHYSLSCQLPAGCCACLCRCCCCRCSRLVHLCCSHAAALLLLGLPLQRARRAAALCGAHCMRPLLWFRRA